MPTTADASIDAVPVDAVMATTAEASDGAPTELKLLTFNLGLLRVRLLGVTAFGSPAFLAMI